MSNKVKVPANAVLASLYAPRTSISGEPLAAVTAAAALSTSEFTLNV